MAFAGRIEIRKTPPQLAIWLGTAWIAAQQSCKVLVFFSQPDKNQALGHLLAKPNPDMLHSTFAR